MKRILLIDDQASIRRNMKILFQEKGYEYFSAGNVKEGKELFAEHDVDLVILDLWMPGENGLVFLDDMNPELVKRKVPVIAYTAFADHTLLEKYGDKLARVLDKPVDPETLFDIVEKVSR